jgi:hypothetical protein
MSTVLLDTALAIALLLGQSSSTDVIIAPSTLTEQRADIALRSADDGRELARRFICTNEQRYRRLLEREAQFSKLKVRFARLFGHEWRDNNSSNTSIDRSSDLGRRDDCKLRDSFEAGLTDYDNGLLAIETQLRDTQVEPYIN